MRRQSSLSLNDYIPQSNLEASSEIVYWFSGFSDFSFSFG